MFRKTYALLMIGLTLLFALALILLAMRKPLPKEQSLPSCSGSFQGGLAPKASATPAPKTPTPTPLVPPTPIPTPIPAAIHLNPRAGFGIADKADPLYWGQQLGAGWYIDWTVRPRPAFSALQHWQMVRITPDCIHPLWKDIRSFAKRYPGQVWIIGNEPDVAWQDNLTPQGYARAYHNLYTLIKSTDPSAQIAVAGISQATPLRLSYLQQVLKIYQEQYGAQLPVDWWTVHGFVLREEQDSWGVGIPPGFDMLQGQLYTIDDHGRLILFQQQIRNFRDWMARNGYRDTPLALTEFGILMPEEYGFPPEMVADYLEQTFTWLAQASDEFTGMPADGNHLVQRWSWFSLSDPLYPSSNLASLELQNFTLAGLRFREFVDSQQP